jgi:hypothetical protein
VAIAAVIVVQQTTVLTLTSQLRGRINLLVALAFWLQSVLNNASRYLWLLDYATAHAGTIASPVAAPARLDQSIDLCAVKFRYPENGGTCAPGRQSPSASRLDGGHSRR